MASTDRCLEMAHSSRPIKKALDLLSVSHIYSQDMNTVKSYLVDLHYEQQIKHHKKQIMNVSHD